MYEALEPMITQIQFLFSIVCNVWSLSEFQGPSQFYGRDRLATHTLNRHSVKWPLEHPLSRSYKHLNFTLCLLRILNFKWLFLKLYHWLLKPSGQVACSIRFETLHIL